MLTSKDFPNFEEDMLLKKGINLQIQVGTDDDSGNKTSRFVDRVVLLIETEVRRHNPSFNFDRIENAKKEAFYEACLEQALYLIVTGDTNLMSGYDPINNSVISIDELRKRALSSLAKDILKVSGLLYRGLSVGGLYGGPIPGHGSRRF